MCGTSLKSCGMKNGITREYVTYMLNVWHIECVTSYVWHIFKVMWDESGNNAGICDVNVECVAHRRCDVLCVAHL